MHESKHVQIKSWCNPTHAIAIFTWSGNKMSLHHSANGVHPPFCPAVTRFCCPHHPTAPSHMSAHSSDCRAEERGTFRHMDLPFVYQQQDKGRGWCGDWPLIGCGSSTLIWLALTCRRVGWGYGLKLGGDSWLLKQCLKGHREGPWQSNNSIPVKWPKWEVLSTGALCLLCAAIFHLCTAHCVPIGVESMCVHVHDVFFYQREKKPGPPTQDSTKMKIKPQTMNSINGS